MKNKREEKRNKKVRTLILLLFLTIIMFGTSTYAWFTANRIVTIEAIDVRVETSDGLQISTNGSTWKSIITKDEILAGYTGHNNFVPDVLDAVSTSGNAPIADGKRLMDMYGATIESEVGVNDGKYTIYTTKISESATPKKFIAFDIFLKVSSNKTVYINSDSGTYSQVVKREGNNYADRGLYNAARVAFVPTGEAAADAAVNTITSAIYATNDPDNPVPNIKIWEPNNDTHSTAVVNSVATEYGYNGVTATGSTPIQYYGIKDALPSSSKKDLINVVKGTVTTYDNSGTTVTFSEAVSAGTVTNSTEYSTSGILLSTPATLVSGKNYKAFDLKAGVTKMRVYMWIEGQDLDCENNASGTDITFKLELSIRGNAS